MGFSDWISIGHYKIYRGIYSGLSKSRGYKRKQTCKKVSLFIVFMIVLFELIIITFLFSWVSFPVVSDIMEKTEIKYLYGFSDFEGILVLQEYYEPNKFHNITLSINSEKETTIDITIFSQPESYEKSPIFIYKRFHSITEGNNPINIQMLTPNEQVRQSTCVLIIDKFNLKNKYFDCDSILDTQHEKNNESLKGLLMNGK